MSFSATSVKMAVLRCVASSPVTSVRAVSSSSAERTLSLLRTVFDFGRVGTGKRRRARNRRAVHDGEVQRYVMELDAPAPRALRRRRAEHREPVPLRIARRATPLLHDLQDVLELHDLRVRRVAAIAQPGLQQILRELALRLRHRLQLQAVALELRDEVPPQPLGGIELERGLLALLRCQRRRETSQPPSPSPPRTTSAVRERWRRRAPQPLQARAEVVEK